jgi:hypothetical protein
LVDSLIGDWGIDWRLVNWRIEDYSEIVELSGVFPAAAARSSVTAGV